MMGLMEFICYDVGTHRIFPGWVVGALCMIDGSKNKIIEPHNDTLVKYFENKSIVGHERSMVPIDYHEAWYGCMIVLKARTFHGFEILPMRGTLAKGSIA